MGDKGGCQQPWTLCRSPIPTPARTLRASPRALQGTFLPEGPPQPPALSASQVRGSHTQLPGCTMKPRTRTKAHVLGGLPAPPASPTTRSCSDRGGAPGSPHRPAAVPGWGRTHPPRRGRSRRRLRPGSEGGARGLSCLRRHHQPAFRRDAHRGAAGLGRTARRLKGQAPFPMPAPTGRHQRSSCGGRGAAAVTAAGSGPRHGPPPPPSPANLDVLEMPSLWLCPTHGGGLVLPSGLCGAPPPVLVTPGKRLTSPLWAGSTHLTPSALPCRSHWFRWALWARPGGCPQVWVLIWCHYEPSSYGGGSWLLPGLALREMGANALTLQGGAVLAEAE